MKSSGRALLQAKQHPKRLGTISIVRNYSASPAESAPNPKAYIDSGVIKQVQNVDVKKVLVIGSGGLAIGQAGEFDYSGSCFVHYSSRHILNSVITPTFRGFEPRASTPDVTHVLSQR